MNIVLSLLGLLALIVVLTVFFSKLRGAPEGVEDAGGFHPKNGGVRRNRRRRANTDGDPLDTGGHELNLHYPPL